MYVVYCLDGYKTSRSGLSYCSDVRNCYYRVKDGHFLPRCSGFQTTELKDGQIHLLLLYLDGLPYHSYTGVLLMRSH